MIRPLFLLRFFNTFKMEDQGPKGPANVMYQTVDPITGQSKQEETVQLGETSTKKLPFIINSQTLRNIMTTLGTPISVMRSLDDDATFGCNAFARARDSEIFLGRWWGSHLDNVDVNQMPEGFHDLRLSGDIAFQVVFQNSEDNAHQRFQRAKRHFEDIALLSEHLGREIVVVELGNLKFAPMPDSYIKSESYKEPIKNNKENLKIFEILNNTKDFNYSKFLKTNILKPEKIRGAKDYPQKEDFDNFLRYTKPSFDIKPPEDDDKTAFIQGLIENMKALCQEKSKTTGKPDMITLKTTRIQSKNSQENDVMKAWVQNTIGPDDMKPAGLRLDMRRQKNHVMLTGSHSFLFQGETGIVERPSTRIPEESLDLTGRLLMAYLDVSRRSVLADRLLPEGDNTLWNASFFPEGVIYFKIPTQKDIQDSLKGKDATQRFFENHIIVKLYATNSHQTMAQVKMLQQHAQGVMAGWCVKMSAFLGENALRCIQNTRDITLDITDLKL